MEDLLEGSLRKRLRSSDGNKEDKEGKKKRRTTSVSEGERFIDSVISEGDITSLDVMENHGQNLPQTLAPNYLCRLCYGVENSLGAVHNLSFLCGLCTLCFDRSTEKKVLLSTRLIAPLSALTGSGCRERLSTGLSTELCHNPSIPLHTVCSVHIPRSHEMKDDYLETELERLNSSFELIGYHGSDFSTLATVTEGWRCKTCNYTIDFHIITPGNARDLIHYNSKSIHQQYWCAPLKNGVITI